MGSAPSLRAPSHTNPRPVQSCLTDHSIARTYAHLDVQNDNKATSVRLNIFCCFHTITRINVTILLIISNVWAGFFWKTS